MQNQTTHITKRKFIFLTLILVCLIVGAIGFNDLWAYKTNPYKPAKEQFPDLYRLYSTTELSLVPYFKTNKEGATTITDRELNTGLNNFVSKLETAKICNPPVIDKRTILFGKPPYEDDLNTTRSAWIQTIQEWMRVQTTGLVIIKTKPLADNGTHSYSQPVVIDDDNIGLDLFEEQKAIAEMPIGTFW